MRLRKTSYPHFYWSNRTPASRMDSSDKGVIAARALGLATLNVTGFGIMLVGGIGWAFDLSSIEELSHRTRRSLMRPGVIDSEGEKQVEAEMERFMDGIYEKLGLEKPEKMDWEEIERKDAELKRERDEGKR